MQLFNLLKVIFFIHINHNLKKNAFCIKKKKYRKFLKKINTIFYLTKNKGFLKIYLIKGNYIFKKFIKKKLFKGILFDIRIKKAVGVYLKKIIKSIFLKMLIINKNRFNFYFFIKTKKINIKNVRKKRKYTKYKRKVPNVMNWIFFIIIKNLFKKYGFDVNFFILFNKSHSNMNEKLKKLRRK